jgi:hypothetical protein
MADLENNDRLCPIGLTVGKGIDAGTQDHMLAEPARHCVGEAAFCIAARYREACPPLRRERRIVLGQESKLVMSMSRGAIGSTRTSAHHLGPGAAHA